MPRDSWSARGNRDGQEHFDFSRHRTSKIPEAPKVGKQATDSQRYVPVSASEIGQTRLGTRPLVTPTSKNKSTKRSLAMPAQTSGSKDRTPATPMQKPTSKTRSTDTPCACTWTCVKKHVQKYVGQKPIGDLSLSAVSASLRASRLRRPGFRPRCLHARRRRPSV